MGEAIEASGTEMVPVAMKRLDPEAKEDDMLQHIRKPGISAITYIRSTACQRRLSLLHNYHGNALKLMVKTWKIHPDDPKYLLPDP